jgi:hypothetical protein
MSECLILTSKQLFFNFENSWNLILTILYPSLMHSQFNFHLKFRVLLYSVPELKRRMHFCIHLFVVMKHDMALCGGTTTIAHFTWLCSVKCCYEVYIYFFIHRLSTTFCDYAVVLQYNRKYFFFAKKNIHFSPIWYHHKSSISIFPKNCSTKHLNF